MTVTVRRGALPPASVAAIEALAARVAARDGVAALGEATMLALTAGAASTVHLLVGEPPLGYAQVDLAGSPPVVEIAVDPPARRRGLGRALLVAAAELAPGGAVWAHGDLPAARALAASAGLVPTRRLAVLAREVGPADVLPDPPPGVTLAPFRPGRDEAAWLAVNAAAFADHPEQGRLTAEDLARRTAQPWFDTEDLVLARRDGEVVGSVWVKVEDPASGAGELYVLGIAPAAQGTGLGAALTRVALARVAGRGLHRCLLYVDADDARAVGVYTRAGFAEVSRHVQYGPLGTRGAAADDTMTP